MALLLYTFWQMFFSSAITMNRTKRIGVLAAGNNSITTMLRELLHFFFLAPSFVERARIEPGLRHFTNHRIFLIYRFPLTPTRRVIPSSPSRSLQRMLSNLWRRSAGGFHESCIKKIVNFLCVVFDYILFESRGLVLWPRCCSSQTDHVKQTL